MALDPRTISGLDKKFGNPSAGTGSGTATPPPPPPPSSPPASGLRAQRGSSNRKVKAIASILALFVAAGAIVCYHDFRERQQAKKEQKNERPKRSKFMEEVMAEVEKRHPVKFDTPDSIIKEIEDENKKKQLVVKYRGKSIVTRDFVRDFDHGYINVNNQKIPTSWDIAISRGPARGILFIGKDQFEMNGDSVKAVGRLSGQLGTEEEAIKLAKTVFAQQVKTACIAMKGAATPTVPFAAFAASNGFGRMAQGAFGITDLVDPDARPESKGPSRFSFALLVLESKGKLYARGRWNFPGAGGYVYDRVPETPLEKTRDEKWQLPSTYSLSGFNRIPEKQKALRERLEDYLNKKLIPEMNKAQPLQAPTEITRQPKKLSFEQMKGVVPTRMHLAGAKRQNWPQQKRG